MAAQVNYEEISHLGSKSRMRFLHSFARISFRLLPTFKIGLKFLYLDVETNRPQHPKKQ
jgi:hypothetical protein